MVDERIGFWMGLVCSFLNRAWTAITMNNFAINSLSTDSKLNAKSNSQFRSRLNLALPMFCLLLLAGLLSVSGCSVGEFGGSTSKSAGDGKLSGQLTLTGSSTIAPVIQEIATRFEKAHPGVRIDVQTGGSSRGIRDAKKGAADIGMSSRHLKDDESNDLDTTIIGWDGVAFVINKKNPTKEITQEQLRQIYLGKINNWSAVGGPNERIVVSNRAAGRSELDLVCKFLNIETGGIQADIIDGETQQSLKSVINNSKAITYTSVGAAQDSALRGEPLKLLPLDGIEASSESVRSGKFPLARPLILTVKKKGLSSSKAKLVKEFLEFATDEDVADVVNGLGFVPNHGATATADAK